MAIKRMSFRKYPEGLQQLDHAGSITRHSQWAFRYYSSISEILDLLMAPLVLSF